MADYFDLAVAYNPEANGGQGELVAGSAFQAFLPDDSGYTTPLQVFDKASGVPLSALVSNNVGVLPQIRVAGDPEEIVLKSGDFVTRVTSKFGTKGDDGASAFTLAVQGGFEGTEADFIAILGGIAETVTSGLVDASGHLILELSTGGTVDAGAVRGEDGAPGLGFIDPGALPAGYTPVTASGVWAYEPKGTAGGGSADPTVQYFYWDETTGFGTVPVPGPSVKLRWFFDSPTIYDGPTYPGVLDMFILRAS